MLFVLSVSTAPIDPVCLSHTCSWPTTQFTDADFLSFSPPREATLSNDSLIDGTLVGALCCHCPDLFSSRASLTPCKVTETCIHKFFSHPFTHRTVGCFCDSSTYNVAAVGKGKGQAEPPRANVALEKVDEGFYKRRPVPTTAMHNVNFNVALDTSGNLL